MDRLRMHKHTRCLATHIMGLLPRSCLLLVVVVLLVHDATTQNGSSSTTSASNTCNTDICVLSCEGCGEGTQVPNPDNCRGFYLCDATGVVIDIPLECGTGQVFDATEHMCVQGEDCEPCTSPPPASTCVYECEALPADTTFPANISVLTDCQHYYECDDKGAMTPMICPAEAPFFGGVECQTDETNCCHCRPYCPIGGTSQQVADPKDCRKFYVCTDEGEVPVYSGSCSDGQYFDSFMNECNNLVSCVSQCTNVVDADGCIEPLTCLETGYFARCPTRCTPYYYHCTEATGEYQDVESCNGETLYNPDTHTCVPEANCPYPP